MFGCKRRVQNLSRHFKNMHEGSKLQDYKPTKKKVQRSFRGKGKLLCASCGRSTIRLDQHLKKVHKIQPTDPEFEYIAQKSNLTRQIKTQETRHNCSSLEEALKDYKTSLRDRGQGRMRHKLTAEAHASAVRFFLKSLRKEAIDDLTEIGRADGLVDTILREKRLSPASLRVYLTKLSRFLIYLATSAKWKSHLRRSTDDLKELAEKVRLISHSLREDVWRERVARHASGEGQLHGLEEHHIGTYIKGPQPLRARLILGKRETINTNQSIEARDSLINQILIQNAARAGVVTHIKTKAILDARIPQGDDATEIFVAEHKVARSGKPCPVRLPAQLLRDLKMYAEKCCRPADHEEYLFLSRAGKQLTPSVSACYVHLLTV